MARPEFIKEHSGLAAGREEVLSTTTGGPGNPLALISRPILKTRPEQRAPVLAPWQIPAKPSEVELPCWQVASDAADEDTARLEAIIKGERAFILGGTQLIVEFGLKQAWYRDDDRRAEAIALIEQRGWWPLLISLLGKENDDHDLFGKGELPGWLQTLPPIKRFNSEQPQAPMPEVRRSHPLRLRKVIELLVLTEAILNWRFSNNKSLDRFEAVSGRPREEAIAAYVYDHMWIEPLLYLVWPRPRHADVLRIIENERIAQAFEAETGQQRWVLHSILTGAPGKLSTVEAAARACNTFYGASEASNGPKESIAVSILRESFGKRVKHIDPNGEDYPPPPSAITAEDPRELGPIGGPAMEEVKKQRGVKRS